MAAVSGIKLVIPGAQIPDRQVILPAPQPLLGIIDKQMMSVLPVCHGNVVLAAQAAGHGAVVIGLPQFPGDPGGQRPVIGIDAVGGLVAQNPLHQGKAFVASLLDTPAGSGLQTVLCRITAIDLVQAVFPEEGGLSQIDHRTGKRTVRAHTDTVAVGGKALVALPVFEIPQLAGI